MSVQNLIADAVSGKTLTRQDIIQLLSIHDDEKDLALLFNAAQTVRNKHFQNNIFIYGFVYFSTYCHNNCCFCNFRRSHDNNRYRKTTEEIVDITRRLYDSGIHLVDLTMGEDTYYHQEGLPGLLSAIDTIKRDMDGLPVMISPGLVDNPTLDAFAAHGTDWYAVYQETHNEALFNTLRIGQDFNKRMEAKAYARSIGMLIEEGLLVGVGESLEDIADSLLTMQAIGAKQMRVMSFIPHPGTPMENIKTPQRILELKVIALMRLLNPTVLTPASLDVDGMEGLSVRVNAGANVITSIIPPRLGLSGVAQTGDALAEEGRTVEEATEILHQLGLQPATREAYKTFIEPLKEKPCLQTL